MDEQSHNNQPPETPVDAQASSQQPQPSIEPIEWTASEYIAHEKSRSWYLALGVGGLIVLALVFFLTRGDILSSIVVIFAVSALGVYAQRKPTTQTYRITDDGVFIGGELQPYTKFQSFSVVEEGVIDSIWLKPIGRFAPQVVMYFEPNDLDRIADTLALFLPHEERQLDAIDQLSRKVRF